MVHPQTRPIYQTPAQVAERWACSRDAVLRLIHSGRLRAFSLTPGKSVRPRWRIPLDAIEEYERSQSTSPAPPPARAKKRKRSERTYYR